LDSGTVPAPHSIWCLEAPTSLEGRLAGRKAAARKATARSAGHSETALCVDGARQSEALLASLTSAHPLMVPLLTGAPDALPPPPHVRWPATYARCSREYNATTVTRAGRGQATGGVRLWLVATRDVHAGEEITVDPACCCTFTAEERTAMKEAKGQRTTHCKRVSIPATQRPPEAGMDRIDKLQRLFGEEDDEEGIEGAVENSDGEDEHEAIGTEPAPIW